MFKTIFDLFVAFDLKTAGWKTYVCLAVCLLLVLLAHFKPGLITPEEALTGVGVAASAGGLTNYLGRTRE